MPSFSLLDPAWRVVDHLLEHIQGKMIRRIVKLRRIDVALLFLITT